MRKLMLLLCIIFTLHAADNAVEESNAEILERVLTWKSPEGYSFNFIAKTLTEPISDDS